MMMHLFRLLLTSSSLVRAKKKFQGARLLNSYILASMHQLFVKILVCFYIKVFLKYPIQIIISLLLVLINYKGIMKETVPEEKIYLSRQIFN